MSEHVENKGLHKIHNLLEEDSLIGKFHVFPNQEEKDDYGTVTITRDGANLYRTSFEPSPKENPAKVGGIWQGTISPKLESYAVGNYHYQEIDCKGEHRFLLLGGGYILVLMFNEEEKIVATTYWRKSEKKN